MPTFFVDEERAGSWLVLLLLISPAAGVAIYAGLYWLLKMLYLAVR